MALVFQLKTIDTEKDFDVIFPVFSYKPFFDALGITNDYVKIDNIDQFTQLVKDADLTQIDGTYTDFDALFAVLGIAPAARKFDFYVNFILDCLHYNYNIILVNCNSTTPSINANRINKAFNENKVKFFIYDPLKDGLDSAIKSLFEEKRLVVAFNTKIQINGSLIFPENNYINFNTTATDFSFEDCSLRTEITGSNFTFLAFSIGGVKRIKRYYSLDDVDGDSEFANSPFVLIPLLSDGAGCLSRSYKQFPWSSPAGFVRGKMLNQPVGASQQATEQVIPDTPEDLSGSATSELGIAYAARINTFLKTRGTEIAENYYLLSDFSGVLENTIPVKTSISYAGLLSYINTQVRSILNRSIYELNDQFLRNSVKQQVEVFLNYIRSNQGIDEYSVVCDESNNTTTDIQNRKLIVDVYIKPSQSINFIELSFTT
jgi:hypothetical protein